MSPNKCPLLYRTEMDAILNTGLVEISMDSQGHLHVVCTAPGLAQLDEDGREMAETLAFTYKGGSQ